MLTFLFFGLLVGIATAEYGWRPGTQYSYGVRGRTVTGLHQVTNQFTGVLMRAKLNIQAKSDSTLSLQITGAEYAEVHRNLSNGWDTDIADESLNYIKLSLHNGPFELYLDDGVIKEMTVDQSIPVWELNTLKSIASLLQINIKAENVIKSQMNKIPSSDSSLGTFKTMEDSINGVYETLYDISQIQEYALLNQPDMLPLPHLVGNGTVFKIVKNRNFSNSDQHIVYYSEIDDQTKWKPGSNQMGNFLTRTSISQIIVSGNLKQYTIQSSATTDKIILAPHLYNKQRGMVGSRITIALESVNSIKLPLPVVSNPWPIRNLVYEYNHRISKHKVIWENMNVGLSDLNLDASIDLESQIRQHKFSNSSYISSSKESEYINSHELNYFNHSIILEPLFIDYITIFNDRKNGHDVLNSSQNIIRLTFEIGQGIISPNTLTGEQILNKFSLLVHLVRTMSSQQLKEVSETIYYPYMKTKKANSGDIARNYQAWLSFRDAVGQAGSGPALMTIREWIVSNKIVGEEASHLIMLLSKSAKYPTTDYIEYFFDMLNDDMIKSQISLRSSAVLSFTELVCKTLVNPRTEKNNLVYFLKSIKKKNDSALLEKYVMYFQKRLQESVELKNSINIQLYIRALNNIAHPSILKVFKPYLEGKTTISKFQRFTIIASMDNIVKLYPNLARTILFRIYNNMADTPEIRIAAVMQFMKTNPPVLMLQSMAQQTNFDKNKQVNAAVKSAIESVAKQEVNLYNKDIVQKARAAVNMLVSENYGLHNSRNFLNSFIVKERNIAYKHHLAYIQSADSLFPTSFFYNLKNNIGGYKYNSHDLNFMTSSSDKLIDLLYDGLFGYNNKKQRRDKKIKISNSILSLNNIYNTLNFEEGENEELEGQILAKILGVKRYFAFDNNTLQNISDIVEVVTSVMDNNRFNYTNIDNQYSVEIMFPTAMGFSFFYTLDTPTLLNVGLQLTGARRTAMLSNHSADPFENFSVAGNYNIVYSTRKEGKMGFVTPSNGKIYTAGLERNMHVHIPIKMDVTFDLKKFKVSAVFEPIEKIDPQKLFEYSTRAFTSIQDSKKMNSLMSGKDTLLAQNEPTNVVRQIIGKEKCGFSFDIKMETDKKNLRINNNIYNHLKGHDMVSLASFFDLLDEINNLNYSITFDPRNSWSKKMELSFSFSKIINAQKAAPLRSDYGTNETEILRDTIFNNKQSYHELFKNVGMNIKDGQTNIFQLKVGFKGLYESEYELSFASSNSYTSNISQIVAIMKNSTTTHLEPKSYLGALEVTTLMPTIPLVMHGNTFKTVPPSKIKGRFLFGEQPPYKSHIIMEGDFYTSQERLKYLKKHPLSILCEKQIQEGYKLQHACRNISRRMNYLDKYKLRISYEHLPNDFKNTMYMVYRYINNIWYDYSSENFELKEDGENINVEVKFGRSLLSSNLSIITSEFSDKFVNIPIHEWVRPLIVLHPQYSMMERLGHKIMVGQQSPTCTYDKDQITTFDNYTYYVNLGNKAHILTQYIPKNHHFKENENNDEYFSVIVGQHFTEKLDLSIIVGDDILEIIQSKDSLLNLVYNGKKVVISDNNEEFQDYKGIVILKLIALPEDAMKLVADKHGFEIIYNGNHITVTVSNKFRNKLKGLCGNFDGESYNEFTTPQNCIANNRDHFIESYGFLYKNIKINKGTKKHPRSLKNACYWQTYLFGTVVNKKEVDHYISKRKKINYEETIKKILLKEMIEASTNYNP